jgi:hypothetical protein
MLHMKILLPFLDSQLFQFNLWSKIAVYWGNEFWQARYNTIWENSAAILKKIIPGVMTAFKRFIAKLHRILLA